MVIKGKRGVFFTALVIVIISLFILSFTLYTNIYERKAIEKRISTMNSFLSSTELDLSRKVYIFGYRFIFLEESQIIDSGSYISNLNSSMQEAFFNGTINRQVQDLLQGTTFNDIITNINQSAGTINAKISFTSPSIQVIQYDPWHLTFILTTNLSMQDEGNLASWNKISVIEANVSIDNFEDPIYYIGTDGALTNNITETPFTTFVSGTNISNLTVHALKSYYKASTNAPSFIQRLQGINTADQNGIESLVNLQRLSQQGISVQDKSVVDYIYFSTQNPSTCRVTGMPSWFKIDNAHASAYNITC